MTKSYVPALGVSAEQIENNKYVGAVEIRHAIFALIVETVGGILGHEARLFSLTDDTASMDQAP